MVTKIWVDIGLGNGLVPDGTKPLPEPMLTYQWVLWWSHDSSFPGNIHDINLKDEFEN